MDSESDSHFEGFSCNSGDFLDTISDIELSDSDSDIPDDDTDDSDIGGEDQWSEDLNDVEISRFNEFVGPRHQLPENASALDFFSLLFEPEFF